MDPQHMLLSLVRWKLRKGMRCYHHHSQEKSHKADVHRKTCLWKRTVWKTRSHQLYRGKQMYRHLRFLPWLFLPQSSMSLLLQDSLMSKDRYQENVRVYRHQKGKPFFSSPTPTATAAATRKHLTHCKRPIHHKPEKINQMMIKSQRPHRWSYLQEDGLSCHPLFSDTSSKGSGGECR